MELQIKVEKTQHKLQSKKQKNLARHSRIEVRDMTAKVDSENGKITSYRTCVKISFGVD